MKVLAIFFREEISSMLNRIIESCNKCGDSTTGIKVATEQLKIELEKYSEWH